MKILNKFVLWKKKQKFTLLIKSRNNPSVHQEKLLLNIIHKNRNTEFGIKHNFSCIKSYDDLGKYVPIRTSRQYKNYLDRMYHGELDILSQQKPFYFAMTAGSTGEFKHIPMNKGLSKEVDNGVLSYLYLFEQVCPDARNKPIQFLVGSAEGGQTPGGTTKGFVSGFHYKHFPSVIRDRFVIPYWVFTIENIAERYYAMVRFLANKKDLVALVSMTPQNLCTVTKFAIEHHERLYQDLMTGDFTLKDTGIYKGELPKFEADKKQAEEFHRCIGETDIQGAVKSLFPSLKYFSTWMGGNMSYAINELFYYYGQKDIFELPSSASEGIFVIPNKLNTPGGIAAITSHFFEYIPEDQLSLATPDVLLVHELEVGKRYYLVITTSGGLYRYNIEDLYEVTGKWGNIPTLRFVSKVARQVSIANERINESDVVEVMNRLIDNFKTPSENFILIPNKTGYYDLVVDQMPNNLLNFSQLFDQELGKNSAAYQYYRDHKEIKPLKVHVIKKHVLQQYIKEIQFRSNLPTGQFKPIHVANSVELFEERFAKSVLEEAVELTEAVEEYA